MYQAVQKGGGEFLSMAMPDARELFALSGRSTSLWPADVLLQTRDRARFNLWLRGNCFQTCRC